MWVHKAKYSQVEYQNIISKSNLETGGNRFTDGWGRTETLAIVTFCLWLVK